MISVEKICRFRNYLLHVDVRLLSITGALCVLCVLCVCPSRVRSTTLAIDVPGYSADEAAHPDSETLRSTNTLAKG
jgi:hypothetical protein